MAAFRRLGMFDEKKSDEQAKLKPNQEAISVMMSELSKEIGFGNKTKISEAKLNSFDEKSENFSTSSPFWNSSEAKDPQRSENSCDILRPNFFENHTWNWAAFFFGPFWGVAKCGIIFIPDFLLFVSLLLAACVAIYDGISFFRYFSVNASLFIYMALHGYFGNYVYQFIVKREIEEGAHVVARYFSLLPEMNKNKRDEYAEKIRKRMRKKYPQYLIVNEENVRDYLKRRPYSGADIIKFGLWILIYIFVKFLLK